MNTKKKLTVDRFIGAPAVIVLNWLARLAGFFLKRNHSFDAAPEKIFVSKYVGMGSIIQSTPLLQSLRASFPAAQLIFITNRNNKSLVERFPFVDTIYYVDDRSISALFLSLLRLIPRLVTSGRSVFLDLEVYSNFSTIITTLSCATNRVGFYLKESAVRLGIYTHMLQFNISYPVLQTYLQMGRLIGCGTIITRLFDFNLSDTQEKIKSNEMIRSKVEGLPENYIVINPNASDLRVERRWPLNNYVQLISSVLGTEKKFAFVFIGNKEESSYVQQLVGLFTEDEKKNMIDTLGRLTLDELIHLINGSRLMITNDTGPMHMAFACNTTCLALFGPCHPVQYGYNENAYCFYSGVYCSPCVHEFLIPPCKGDNQCMKRIRVDEVLQVFQSWLDGSGLPSRITRNEVYWTDDRNMPLGLVRRNLY